MSVGAILTVGLGSFGSVNLLPTLGYLAGSASASVDTHDGVDVSDYERELRRREAEAREEREAMRSDLLAAYQKVTGRPPPLDQSLRHLAATARRLEAFDYAGTLERISKIDGEQAAIQAARDRGEQRERELAIEAERARRLANDNAIKVLLLLKIL